MCTAAPHSCLLHHHRCSRLDSQTLLLGHTQTLHPSPCLPRLPPIFRSVACPLGGERGAGAPRQASPPPLCVRGLCWTGSCSDLVRTHRVRQPPFNTCCSVFFPQIIFGHLKTFAISIHKSTLSVALYKVPL